MKLRRNRHTLSGALIAALLAVAVSLALVAAANAGKKSPSQQPIIIGAVKGVSGFMSSFDVPPLNGAKLAVADINKRGGILGRPLKLIVADYHSKVEDAGPAAKELLAKGASFILTACDFDFGSPAALAAQDAGIVAMSDCAGATQFGVQGIGPLAYTMGNAGRAEGAVMAEFAIKDKKLRTAWMLRDTGLLYYNEVCTGFRDRFTELGGKVVGYETYKSDDASISTQINKLRNIKPAPRMLFICGFPTGGSAAIRQIRSAGFNQPMMSSNSYDGDYWKKAVPGVTNFYFANYASLYGDDPNPKINAFMRTYRNRFGKPDNSNLVTGYSVIQALALAAKKARSLDGEKIAAALDSIKNMPLLVAPTTFTKDLHIDLGRRQEIMVITNGKTKFHKYWKLSKPPKVKF